MPSPFNAMLSDAELKSAVEQEVPRVVPTLPEELITVREFINLMQVEYQALPPLDALTQAVAKLWMRFAQYPVVTVLRKVLQCRHDAGTCVRLGGVYDCPTCRYQMYATVFWASVQEPQMARESPPSAVMPMMAVGPSPQTSVRMLASISSSPFFFSESPPSLPATPDLVLSTLLPAFDQNLPEFEQGSSSLKRRFVEEEDDTAVQPPCSRRRMEVEDADLERHAGFDVPMPDHVADDLARLLATVSQRGASPKYVLCFSRAFISPTSPLSASSSASSTLSTSGYAEEPRVLRCRWGPNPCTFLFKRKPPNREILEHLNSDAHTAGIEPASSTPCEWAGCTSAGAIQEHGWAQHLANWCHIRSTEQFATVSDPALLLPKRKSNPKK